MLIRHRWRVEWSFVISGTSSRLPRREAFYTPLSAGFILHSLR
jgi:hypothetical protein